MDYSTLYEFKEIDFSKLQEHGNFKNGIAFTEPVKNDYEGGANYHVLHYSGHVLIVSKFLDMAILLDDILQENEKEIMIKNHVYSIAFTKLSMVAMKIECITDQSKINNFDRWRACLEHFDVDAEIIADSNLLSLEQYYCGILTK